MVTLEFVVQTSTRVERGHYSYIISTVAQTGWSSPIPEVQPPYPDSQWKYTHSIIPYPPAVKLRAPKLRGSQLWSNKTKRQKRKHTGVHLSPRTKGTYYLLLYEQREQQNSVGGDGWPPTVTLTGEHWETTMDGFRVLLYTTNSKVTITGAS